MPTPIKINPPVRADHIGSLLRPRELIEAFRFLPGGREKQTRFPEEIRVMTGLVEEACYGFSGADLRGARARLRR